MKIGVYVGSFDPPHKGHENIAKHLINKKYIDKIIIIPTKTYWDKQNLTNITDRENMLRLTFKNNAIININLSKYEYTYEIMKELNKIYPNDKLYLILGADNIEYFYKWKNYKEILNNNILIIPRDEINIDELLNKYEPKDKFTIVKDFIVQEISSTFIRENIKNNNIDEIKNLINTETLEYIINNKLYKS